MNGKTTRILKKVFLNQILKQKSKSSKYAWRQFKKFFLGLSHKQRTIMLKPFTHIQSNKKINIATGNSITYVD